MSDPDNGLSRRRARIAWWLFVLALGIVAAIVAWEFVGIIVLGVFIYYATRPIRDEFEEFIDSEAIDAALAVLVLILPIIVLVLYVLMRLFGQIRAFVDGETSGALVSHVDSIEALSTEDREQLKEILRDPTMLLTGEGETLAQNPDVMLEVFGAVSGTILLVSLALTLAYVLLAHDNEFTEAFVELAGGRDTTVYAYAAAVDEDLESVFFGNLLFATIMAVISIATYWLTNLVAPAGIRVPMVLTLGFLTGVTSLIPIIVGKLVYVPVVGYLALQALQNNREALPFVGGVFVVYFLVLDIIPQSFLQPYVSGRQLDMLLLLFAYILGPMMFGWYGFFLFPILMILMLEAVLIVLPRLLSGQELRPTDALDFSPGTSPQDERPDVPDVDASTDEEPTSKRSSAADSATTDGASETDSATTDQSKSEEATSKGTGEGSSESSRRSERSGRADDSGGEEHSGGEERSRSEDGSAGGDPSPGS